MNIPVRVDTNCPFRNYASRLSAVLAVQDWQPVEALAAGLYDCWQHGRQVFLAGNGGSAGNAMHLANDFLYGIGKKPGAGLRVHALPANPSVLSCLANDEGYDKIFSLQLAVHARPDDLLVVLSGSGNSPNIIAALEEARKIGMRSFAILGYDGGKARRMADVSIHIPVDDMQIAEDSQMIVGHMIMQWLHERRDEIEAANRA